MLACFAVAVGSLPAHADLGPIIARYGNWDVHRFIDKMTDKVECVATYQGNSDIQLSRYNLFMKFKGTPEGYRYRLNDEPASPITPVVRPLRKIGAIGFAGTLLDRLVRSERLRVEVSIVRFPKRFEVKQIDLNLSGIYNAYSAVYHCR